MLLILTGVLIVAALAVFAIVYVMRGSSPTPQVENPLLLKLRQTKARSGATGRRTEQGVGAIVLWCSAD